mgnify:CR=1 FL=1
MNHYYQIIPHYMPIYAYKRQYQDQEIVVYNHFYGDQTTSISIDATQYDILLSNVNRQTLQNEMMLKPYESLVLIKK